MRTTDPWFWLRAVVWDATGDSAGNKIVVETWDQGTMAEPLRAGEQVGVLLADGTCSARPPVGDPGRQAWLRTIMETVSRIAYCVVEARTE